MKASIKMPSPAMLVALLALFVALGGSAYAVNKVGTNQIKNNAVTTAKIRNSAVTTAKISNGAVSAAKLGTGSVTGAKLAPGAVGSTVEFTDQSRVEGLDAVITAPPGSSVIGAVSCPEGKTIIFTSWRPLASVGAPPLAVVDMDPYPDESSMRVNLYNGDNEAHTAGLWGLCI